MGNQNNTLEGHLNSFKDLKAQELAAAWIINKRELSKPLSTITTAFPTYSLHDASHSQTIIETIERLLGSNIRKLSATDTFMLLMAAYTHDLGMFLSYKTIEDKWKTKDFAKKINELENHRDPQIAKAAKLLRETQKKFNTTNNSSNGTLLWALEVKNAVTLLTIELFRGEHAKRSEDYLNNDSEFAKLLANIDQYGGLRSTLAKIAYLHCEDFNKVFILDKEANGYTGPGDMCHPRFVACMIRLGDLLDFDNNRFNNFALSMVKEVPETSLVHYRKHLSTGDETSLISPNEIRVSFNCLQDDVYREAAKWKKMVEQELYNMHAFWPEIVPEELSGNGRNGFRLPSAKQINIKLKYQGKENPNPDLMHLRFDISSKKTFEMLKGGAIYQNPGRVFLREIVQNAMDATKLQIWQDIKDGCYPLPWHLKNPARTINSIEDIKFSDDIPTDVYDKYRINLCVEYDDKKEVIWVICEDHGTGISEESLIRMTSRVGESRRADKDYDKNYKGMPYFLQPTAAFGLGLQTVFYVADEFTMETCCQDKTSRRIVFRASTNDSYCSIKEEGIQKLRGTKVIIEIDKDYFGNLFELQEEIVALELSDYEESIKYYIPDKIDTYIQETFERTENIPFYYHSQYKDFQSQKTNDRFVHIKDDECFRVSYKAEDTGTIIFRIEENKYGTILKINYDSEQRISCDYDILLRDVQIAKSQNFPFANIWWNLFCREADALVTISRDGLLPQGLNWCNKMIDELKPIIIQLTHETLLNEFNNCANNRTKKQLQDQYLSMCMIDWQLPNPIIKDYSPLDGLEFPLHWASNNKFKSIQANTLLNASEITLIYGPMFDIDQKKLLSQLKPPFNNFVVCWNRDLVPKSFKYRSFMYFPLDVMNGHIIDYYYIYDMNRVTNSAPQKVELFDKDKGKVCSIPHLAIQGTRSLLIPGFKRYESIVVNNAPLLGYNSDGHCNCWIYPMRASCMDLKIDETNLKQMLENGLIKELVPDYIVKLIQKHNVLRNDHLTEKEIYDTYIRLILDNEFGFEEPSEKKK